MWSGQRRFSSSLRFSRTFSVSFTVCTASASSRGCLGGLRGGDGGIVNDGYRRVGRGDDAGAVERPDDQHPQLPARLELLAGQRAGHHAQRDGVDFDAFQPHHGGRVQQQLPQQRVVERVLALLVQDLVDPVEVGAGRHRDVDHRARPVLGEVDRFDDLAVGDGEQLAIRGAQPGHPQRHVLDGAARLGGDPRDGQRDQVAEAVLLLDDDEKAREQILDQLLSAETQRRTQHRGRRDEPAHRELQHVADLQR